MKKKLEGVLKAKDTMEKARDEAMKARVEAERAREQAEETKEQAEQEAYEMGVAKTETNLKAQVPGGMQALLLPSLGRSPQPSWG